MKYTLKELQEFGCLAENLEVVDSSLANYIEVEKFEEVENLSGYLIQKDSDWVAIASHESVDSPHAIYSCVDDIVCIHKVATREFCVMRVNDKKLNIEKKLIIKEGNRMPEINEALAALKNQAQVSKSHALSDEEKAARKATKDANQAKKAQINNAISNSIQGITQVSNALAQENNRAKGVLYGYIVDTEPVVKLSLAKSIKEVNGQRVVLASFQNDPKVIEAKNNNKTIPAKFCETERKFNFVEKAPGKVKAVVIGTPAKSNISLSYAETGAACQIDESKSDTLEVQFFSLEHAYADILWNYGGEIHESKDVLGENAGIVTVADSRKLDPETQRAVVTYRLVVQRPNKDNRKVTRANMFPVKRYRTVPVGQAGDYISTAIESVMSSKIAKAPELSQITNAAMHNVANNDGKYTADWCTGAPVEYVKFDDKEKNVVKATDFAKIIKKVNAETGKTTFAYETAGIEEADGPMSVYGAFVKATGLSEDVFVARVKNLTARGGNGEGSKGPKKVANPMDSLRAYLAADITVNNQAGSRDKLSSFMNEIKRINNV